METKNLIECGTCGYPLTPEERSSLVEHRGRMVKQWVGLPDEDVSACMMAAYDHVQGRNLELAFARAIEAKLKEKNS